MKYFGECGAQYVGGSDIIARERRFGGTYVGESDIIARLRRCGSTTQ